MYDTKIAQDQYIIYRNRSKIRKHILLLVILGFVSLGTAWLIFSYGIIGPLPSIVLPVLGVVLLIVSLAKTRSLFSSEPAIIIDKNGFHDRSGGLGDLRVSWTNVVGVELVYHNFNDFIVVRLKDPNSLLMSITGYKKAVAKGFLEQLGSPIALTTRSLDIDTNEFYQIMITQWQNSKLN